MTQEVDDQDEFATIPYQPVKKIQFDSILLLPREVEPKKIHDTVIKQMLEDDEYWYVNTVPKRKKVNQENINQEPEIFDSSWFKNLVWIIFIAVFTGVLFWFLLSSNIFLFSKSKAIVVEESEEISEEDLFSMNFEKQIARAESLKDFRLATRLWYLFTLRALAEKNLIRYQQEKTNTDYLDQLYKSLHYKSFFSLTRNFEYTWYGNFDLNEHQYANLQKAFASFKNGLHS
jgi:hypothetical protein